MFCLEWIFSEIKLEDWYLSFEIYKIFRDDSWFFDKIIC